MDRGCADGIVDPSGNERWSMVRWIRESKSQPMHAHGAMARAPGAPGLSRGGVPAIGRWRTTRVAPVCLLLLGAWSIPMCAQTKAGLVGGRATDSAGRPVGGVQIVAHHLATGADQTAVTNAGGLFDFINLEP